jgi:hypothetical protein
VVYIISEPHTYYDLKILVTHATAKGFILLGVGRREAGLHGIYVRFGLLTAVIMKSSIFLDMTSCSTLKVTDASEEYVAYIFRVEEYAKHESA